ncbi:hypothetical protein M422DRAFT_252617 [Sphaerobolus stellatus SS14]|uniref:Methyltransferase domain-containing protein n=1 Tax=Sphaerobolus stellatus (strain SS14) TaxID=990650 RepID=A0A0C9UM29_SPHS4|nr:hypothetical protein M422DRAFT_252617 [Sphaerobolus stellatus SS14]
MSEYAGAYDAIGSKLEDCVDQRSHLLSFLSNKVSKLLPHAPQTALDLGCGTGEPASAYLASLGHKVTGLDFSETMVLLARTKVPNPNATFFQADMLTWEPPKGIHYDLVLASHCLYNFSADEIRSLVFKFAEWVKEDGFVVVGSAVRVQLLEEGIIQFDENGWAEAVPNTFIGHEFLSTYAMADTWRKLLESTGMKFVELEQGYYNRAGAGPEERTLVSFIIMHKDKDGKATGI